MRINMYIVEAKHEAVTQEPTPPPYHRCLGAPAPGGRQWFQRNRGGLVGQSDKEAFAAWKVAPMGDLIRHLVGTCHLECRLDMARLETLMELVALENGRRTRSFLEARELVGTFCRDMRTHLSLEERNLFPHLLGMDQGGLRPEARDSLVPVRKLLEGDHETEATLLRSIRNLTGILAAEEDPASALGRIHEAIKVLSERLQRHFYLESQILFPRMD